MYNIQFLKQTQAIITIFKLYFYGENLLLLFDQLYRFSFKRYSILNKIAMCFYHCIVRT